MCYHDEEGPNHLKTASYFLKKTGSCFFDHAMLLLIQSYCSKDQKETKQLVGFCRHFEVLRCPVHMASTMVFYFYDAYESEMSFIVDDLKSGSFRKW